MCHDALFDHNLLLSMLIISDGREAFKDWGKIHSSLYCVTTLTIQIYCGPHYLLSNTNYLSLGDK